MLEGLRARLAAAARRLRRLERRELDAFWRWIERTENLLHLSVLVFVPLLVAAVTWLSNVSPVVSFLLYPPLASGTYTLFADPEGQYSTPGTFVGGMTAGAFCGWLALVVAAATGLDGGAVSASGAALSVLLTGAVTWALDLEEPTAFSTALLVLVTGNAQLAYVVGIALSSAFVALVFAVWRDRFYEERARYLYRTTQGDDHVLVPMREGAAATASFGASIAGAHEAGKVVLLDVVEAPSESRDAATDGGTADGEGDVNERPVDDAARRLESLAADLEAAYEVPCEVVVAAGDRDAPGLVLQAARENDCDLVATPYEERTGGGLSAFVTGLFEGELDVIAFRSSEPRRRWRRALVAVRGAGDTPRAMVDFALRVVGGGTVGVCTCIDRESERRRAENTLTSLVDAFSGRFETHVATAAVEEYLAEVAPRYDVVVVGSSTDRSAASRFVSPPTFRKLGDLEADVAIVHRGRRR